MGQVKNEINAENVLTGIYSILLRINYYFRISLMHVLLGTNILEKMNKILIQSPVCNASDKVLSKNNY